MSQALTISQVEAGLSRAMDSVAAFLPTESDRKRFAESILQMFRSNETLAGVTVDSLVSCALEVAQLGIDPHPSLKEVYFVPKAGKCTLFFGQGAYLKVLARIGWAQGIQARCVWQGEQFKIEDVSGLLKSRETTYKITHTPTRGIGRLEVGTAGNELIGVYVRLTHSDNRTTTEWYSYEFLEKLRLNTAQGSLSASWKKFPWTMFEKLAIKQAIKRQALLCGNADAARMIWLDNESEDGVEPYREPTRTRSAVTHNALESDRSPFDTTPAAEVQQSLPAPAANPLYEMQAEALRMWVPEFEAKQLDKKATWELFKACKTKEEIDVVHYNLEQQLGKL